VRNVIYADTDTGYACAECGEPITPEEMFTDENWHCGHPAHVKATIITIDAKEGGQ
jgi:methionyl-tRNA synthetase